MPIPSQVISLRICSKDIERMLKIIPKALYVSVLMELQNFTTN